MTRVAVTGGCGFVGSNLVESLNADGIDTTIVDSRKGIDLCNPMGLRYALTPCDAVVHLAANADVRGGWDAPKRDLEQNTVATSNLLDAMRRVGVRRLIFASTGSVNDGPFAQQTSLYAASKVACEALIGAYAEAGHVSATIFRFVSMLGPGYSHGHVADFVKKLRENPDEIQILSGKRKSYLDVSDAVAAIRCRLDADPGFEILNCGTNDATTPDENLAVICRALGVDPLVTHSGESWKGDQDILLDCSRLRAFGWMPRYSIREAIERTVAAL